MISVNNNDVKKRFDQNKNFNFFVFLQEIGLSRIPDQPLLPTFSDKVQHELLMGK